MSRLRHPLPDGGFVIYGDDPRMNTWFAQLFAAGDSTNDVPLKAVGYHPAEVDISRTSDDPRAKTCEFGPYPVTEAQLRQIVKAEWGITLP